jgi:hypothetical protein
VAINHKVTGPIFAVAVGLLASYWSYQWVTNSERGARRAVEEAVVLDSRAILTAYVAEGSEIEFSDPLERVREAGKVYIYPTSEGWEISGQYQRPGERRWHAYLMKLDAEGNLQSLAVRDDDPVVAMKAAEDRLFSVMPPR